ncbi:MAG: hypothetical protein Q9208_006171 [Pyrenodesmia sp. 3 TL-2023]
MGSTMTYSETANSALLVVDMQEDFCPPLQNGALAVPGGRDIAPIINHLLSLPFTIKIATRDFHPPDHISFSTAQPPPNNVPFQSSAEISNPLDGSETTTIPIWPPHCIRNTPGAELIPELDASKIDAIIDKGRDRRVEMFSAFADAFGSKGTEAASFDLAEYLKEKRIKRVFVVGLAGDYCVRYTAVDARKEGYEVFVVDEGVRSINERGEKGWEGVKRELVDKGIRIPKLREEVKEDVKNETNKDGSGKGQMAAWKGMKIAKEYEKKGGSYENEAGSENKPNKGAPEPKSDEQKDEETKDASDDKQEEEKKDEKKEKPKANSGKKATGKKEKGESKAKAPKKEKKTPTEGTRKSSRIGGKRSAPEEEEKTEEKKTPAKKAKTAKK